MAFILALLALLGLAGSFDNAPSPALSQEAPMTTSMVDSGWPPMEHRGERGASVFYLDDVTKMCGPPSQPDTRVLGCEKGGVLVLPNPCTHPEYAGEKFSRLTCHEIGHANGWPGDHPRRVPSAGPLSGSIAQSPPFQGVP